MDWLIEHGTDLLAIYGAVVALCSAIVKLTPSKKDDAFLEKVLKFISILSIFKRK